MTPSSDEGSTEEYPFGLKLLGGDGFSFVTISGGNPALLKNLSYLINLMNLPSLAD